MKEIRKGNVCQDVRILQRLLGVKADGDFWTQTDAAVRSFQKKHALAVDGICGPLTWAALAAEQKEIRLNSRGAAVEAVQDALNITIDGKFGPQTLGAVKAMQKAGGLEADGIVGPITWKYLLTKYALTVVPGVNPVQPVDFKQYDRRWAGVMFSNHKDPKQTIKSSGCGPTATADVLATWFDAAITPVQTCQMAVANRFRTSEDGTSQKFFPWIAKQFNFSRYYSTHSTDEAIKALRDGAYVIALMGPDFWTKGGHYICCWKADSKYIYANDPGSSLRKYASIDIFRKQSRAYFVFYKVTPPNPPSFQTLPVERPGA